MAYAQTTLAQLRTQLQALWDDQPFWSDTDARRAINQALRWWNALTGVFRTQQTQVLPPASPDHLAALNLSLTYRSRLSIAGRPLTGISRLALNAIRPNWMYEYTDSGGDVPTTIQVWAPAGLFAARFWPGNRTNQTLTIEGMGLTPVLSADGDFVQLGDEDLGALLEGALHFAAVKHGGALFQKTIVQHRNFLKAAAHRNQLLLASRAYKRYAGIERDRTLRPAAPPDQAAAVIASLAIGSDA